MSCRGGKVRCVAPPGMWAQCAFKAKPGTLHKMLGVPLDAKIPVSLLKAVVRTPIGGTVRNPAKLGKRTIKVTRLMKQKVVPVLNMGVARGDITPWK